jgi:endonuclease III
MFYWSWKANTQCVCITGVGRKTSNVYVLLELVEKTPKYVCITGVGRKTPNVYVLLELEGKHPMCMYY